MKIVLLTLLYSSKGGGVATVSQLLVRGFRERGHQVMVLTSENCPRETGQHLISRPSIIELIRNIWASDAVIMQGCFLKLGWPLLFFRKKTILVRHIGERRNSFLRKWLTNRCILATVSRFMASCESVSFQVLPNPYDNDIFYDDGSTRDRDILFVGRLIKDKGIMTLLSAFRALSAHGNYSLTIIGPGPEKAVGEEYVRNVGLVDQVDFIGHMDAPQVAQQMRRHKVVVMPSIWQEPFGLVVLEGLACGCRVVAANRGGIPEALNGLGVLYEAEDEHGLMLALRGQLKREGPIYDRNRLESHLGGHQPGFVASKYEELLHSK